MAKDESTERSKARTELRTLSMEDRRVIGNAIIDGLISPAGIAFERLAFGSGGGDYDQNGGPYNQSGGGDHDQGGGGGYTQNAYTRDFGYLDALDVVRVIDGIRNPTQ